MEKSLVDKLIKINGDFPLEDYSISKYLIPVMFPEKFGVSFNENDLTEISERVVERIDKNFNSCVIPTLEYIIAKSGGNYINFEDESKNLSTEFNLLKKLSSLSYSNLNLSKTALKELSNVKKAKSACENGYSIENINLLFYHKKDFMNSNKSKIEYIMAGKKLSKSLVLKILSRVSKLENLKYEDLRKINSFRVKKKYDKGALNKQEINTYSWTFIKKAFQSSRTFHDFFHSNALKEEIGSNLYEIVGDIFVIDGARGKIVTKKSNMESLQGIIEYIPNIDLIESRCDDFYNCGTKDRSVVYALKGGKKNRNYAELRIQTIDTSYEAEFGDFAHYRYKRERLNDLINTIKKTPSLYSAANNLCDLFNLDINILFD